MTDTNTIFTRTVPFVMERHYFGETKKTSMDPVQLDGIEAAEQQRTKALLSLQKRLINSPEMRAVRTCDATFRRFLLSVATPFRPGMYLVPVGLVERVDATARLWEAERNDLADAATTAYPAHVQEMRAPLGALFNDADYPTPEVFRSRFWTECRFVDFGVASAVRTLRADIFQRETAKLERQAAEARTLIEQHLRGSLLEITQHLRGLLVPKASGKRSALRANCLDDLSAFLATVEQRNVTGDHQLSAVVTQLRRVASTLDLEILRTDEELRNRSAHEMTTIATQLSALVIDQPVGRGIRIREDREVA